MILLAGDHQKEMADASTRHVIKVGFRTFD